jgi:hypothetical protein
MPQVVKHTPAPLKTTHSWPTGQLFGVARHTPSEHTPPRSVAQQVVAW